MNLMLYSIVMKFTFGNKLLADISNRHLSVSVWIYIYIYIYFFFIYLKKN